jgi:uncharacterized phage infection (PIP) family protein YhgE
MHTNREEAVSSPQKMVFNTPRVFQRDMQDFWKKFAILAPVQVVVLLIVALLTTALALGANWDFSPYLKNINVVIVNQDKDTVGDFIQNSLTPSPPFTWRVDNNNTDIRSYVQDGNAWYGVLILPNTTKNLMSSILAENSTLLPIQIIFDQARNFNGQSILSGILQSVLTQISINFSNNKLPELIPNNTSFIAVNKNVRRDAIPTQLVPMNPRPSIGHDFTSGIWVTFMVLLAATIEASCVATWVPLLGKLDNIWLHFLRAITIIVVCFFASLGVTLIVLAFGAQFKYGFMPVWMWFWLTLYAECIMLGALGTWARKATGFIIPIFIILLNVSAQVTMPYELSNGFYYIGLALPVAHAVEGARTVISGGYNRIGMNLGVIFAWIIICFIAIGVKIEIDFRVEAYQKKRKEEKEKKALEKEPTPTQQSTELVEETVN